ncbi:TIGR02757 family protein [Myroides odoratus]|uniref:TIGR02757 family protein n=1 Tax=Myroides odoratus TaxID=256 RepID=A0A9Q6Z3L1_MYROD|nr:TIGR02757 family protein [Myroides odoratus]EHQ41007.1 Conserved hypothetical protein CHP02757 [Myroides odoratus DSM 2801]EKB08361.1 TIGR02757 family protein [Myroides odoratus CIP 103059]QQT98465.1 TIGR02757 family protein [Myroides odoratus]WQD59366.1 TIGR02757 family protein [Myroides odoratus]STZ32041.1 Protein of uncharacterised function (DUF2400) [Myroides odoratus]
MNKAELKEFLDEKVLLYNNPSFIVDDPVQIPHLYTQKEDIEIGGFLSATIAWGNRKMIIKNAHKMMELMGNSPYDFVMNHNEDQLDALTGFVHRTFNSTDFATFIQALQHIYRHHGGLEGVFSDSSLPLQERISKFKTLFFEIQHQQRTQKHISDPLKGSAAKRINMYLRWMVRQDNAGVDFGLWKGVSPSELSCPLDVHSGNMARKLGILKRTQNDAKALLELDTALRELDPVDPVKYDFALFGLGAIEKF